MTVYSSQLTCPAAMLANSLLEVWLSEDRYRLRQQLERLCTMPEPSERDDEWDRIELLKGIAWRMRETSELSAPRLESPQTAAWLDLLNHLSVAESPVN
jgi:hypothetical protein